MHDSIARANPTYSGRKSVDPPSGAEPCFGPAWPKTAVSAAIEKSHAMPISWPPAMRMPLTRLMTGLSHSKNRRDHVVEKPHVLAVLQRPAGVDLRVLRRVAAGAERTVPGAGEHHGNDVTVHRSPAEGQDDLLDRLGGVRVELALVVERDPGREEAARKRLLLILDVGKREVFDEFVVFQHA